MAERYKCFWLIDIIASYQLQLNNEDFQVWDLKVCKDRSTELICSDGDTIFKQQHISYTDFGASTATIWIEGNVILLPSEH